MVHIRVDKTNFTAGEISPRLFGRGDLTAYANGAKELRNVFIQPTGGVTRRDGLRFLDTLRGDGRLIAFEFNTQQVYLLVFTNLKMDIYRDGVNIADIDVPWTIDQIRQINWTQSADTLLIVHPDVPPKKITRTSDNDWSVNDWTFFTENARIYQPMHKYADDETTYASGVERRDPDGFRGSLCRRSCRDTVSTGEQGSGNHRRRFRDVGDGRRQGDPGRRESHQGFRGTGLFRGEGLSHSRLLPSGSLGDRGFPQLPNRLWLSKSAICSISTLARARRRSHRVRPFIRSGERHPLCFLRASFTGLYFRRGMDGYRRSADAGNGTTEPKPGSARRWTGPSRPETDGATLFVQREGFGLREFIYSDVEQGYQSNDVAILSRHVGSIPVDQDYDQANRFFHIVMANGGLSTLTVFRRKR